MNAQTWSEQFWRKGDSGLWNPAMDGKDLQFVWLWFPVEGEETDNEQVETK